MTATSASFSTLAQVNPAKPPPTMMTGCIDPGYRCNGGGPGKPVKCQQI